MKLTKLQRHTAYIIMLAWFEEADINCYRFYCEALKTVFDLPWDSELLKVYFPDLYKKKPAHIPANCAWFGNDNKKRIKILKQCIEETY